MKAVLRGKLSSECQTTTTTNKQKTKTTTTTTSKNLERAYTSSLTAHLKTLEQKEANTPKRSRRQEIIKLWAEINQVETKRTIQRINETSAKRKTQL